MLMLPMDYAVALQADPFPPGSLWGTHPGTRCPGMCVLWLGPQDYFEAPGSPVSLYAPVKVEDPVELVIEWAANPPSPSRPSVSPPTYSLVTLVWSLTPEPSCHGHTFPFW